MERNYLLNPIVTILNMVLLMGRGNPKRLKIFIILEEFKDDDGRLYYESYITYIEKAINDSYINLVEEEYDEKTDTTKVIIITDKDLINKMVKEELGFCQITEKGLDYINYFLYERQKDEIDPPLRI